MNQVWLAVIPATIPTLAVLVGILLNQNGLNRLEGRMTSMENRLDARVNTLEARIDAFSRQLTDGLIMLIGRDTDKSERLARLEERNRS